MTRSLVAISATVLFGCPASVSTTPASAPLVRIQHCVGEVVPLCATVLVTEAGVLEYVRNGKRTLTARLPVDDTNELRQKIAALDISAWPHDDSPVGSFISLKIPAGTRTFVIADVPVHALPALEFIDQTGRRLFGATYRPMVAGH